MREKGNGEKLVIETLTDEEETLRPFVTRFSLSTLAFNCKKLLVFRVKVSLHRNTIVTHNHHRLLVYSTQTRLEVVEGKQGRK